MYSRRHEASAARSSATEPYRPAGRAASARSTTASRPVETAGFRADGGSGARCAFRYALSAGNGT
jgi:hypothetical protein